MKITRSKVLRAAPVFAGNLIALVAVVVLDLSVTALFVLFVLETWIMVLFDGARMACAPSKEIHERLDNVGEGVGFALVGSFFASIHLAAAIIVLAGKEFTRQATGNLMLDLVRYLGALGLAVPLCAIAIIQFMQFLREMTAERAGRPVESRAGASLMRLIMLVVIFIFALGPATFMGGAQAWPLIMLIVIKCAGDISIDAEIFQKHIAVQRWEKEKRDYQATLDPRGTGTWPTSPPKKTR
jgi:hypothetical protein